MSFFKCQKSSSTNYTKLSWMSAALRYVSISVHILWWQISLGVTVEITPLYYHQAFTA